MGVKVRQKVKGKGKPWWVFISHNGKRTSRKIGDKRAAESIASKIRERLASGDFNIDNNKKSLPTFNSYADGYMETQSKINHKPSTRESYKYVLNSHILPVFGDHKLDEIQRKDIKHFILSKKTGGLSISTTRIILSYFSAILNEAVDDEIINVNPATGVRKIIGKKIELKINPLSATELNNLLETVKEKLPKYYPLFLTLARTGMRIGEAMALRWSDIDFNSRFIEVKRSYGRYGISTPKSGKTRKIDMSLQLSETLREHHTQSKKKGLRLGQGDLELVFTNRYGSFIHIDNWRRYVFRRALKEAGLRRIRIHDLRHTYATLRISKGDNIADVSNQLGHHSVNLTLDIYYHWVPGKQKTEVDALDNLHLSAPDMHPEFISGKISDSQI